ncbi:DNA mismatch repair protein MutS [bacterium (Candidatus Blackallbacteria) CG17_big_fil_post_rev_8_21_14_2_50_48_46]|uniref:DNA mismatch repair protein MutS n=1 Tax=bacterium (Candidatus Blackallbacteria) CG17_big_fil_post_rev_8_21_14_2_50_48_46 TaxID=2014261 RepID=A0A2M7G3P4_9BACT|nr:MAG: DNA mismatch repair protein MutS [bacterium (Candidatus Blackallbacteria) CG18_big_fil_WC_8_21_14_2_50_49_26]PIW16485.1 MAG: DNA mismatch repair protein MutS [bacterium (Candidatus Blackallbacteria) CG17_big_fil_post_rev_8_21_14_2_50_48_46]PIW45993.1 MAG: DNA mismatch repair protein MutS [bacterium (Candidatus Blackallbacteria) CG13_big_fil_rev_8_21_14_2_50_49_14]
MTQKLNYSELDPQDYTPMMQQFLEVKRQYPHTLLLYRMGDFYETFFEDAQIAARELEITLTAREGGQGKKIDMAGIPFHALEAYLPRLIGKGYKVAICEQMEAPRPGKLVKREVIRVITPGTLLEGAMLQEKRNNYLGAVCRHKGSYGLAYTDISTGEFRLTQISGENAADLLTRELAGLELAETLLPSDQPWGEARIEDSEWAGMIPDPQGVTWESRLIFDPRTAEDRIKHHFGIQSLESYGCQDMPQAVAAAGAVLHYLSQTQMSALKQLQPPVSYLLSQFLVLDRSTRRNLELTQTYRENSFEGSLLWVLDQTRTAMGGRLLRDWLNHPLLDIPAIEARLDAVQELTEAGNLRFDLREQLDGIRDLERLSARVATQAANPRELRSLAEGLLRLPRLSQCLESLHSSLFQPLRQVPVEVLEMAEKVLACLQEAPSVKIQEGGIFRDGIQPELDELRQLMRGGKSWINELEQQERERTGIKSLKVGYSKTFGYFIEITHSNKDAVPDDYLRKQTLTNAERFITPALKEKEAAILNADEQVKHLEYELYLALRTEVAEHLSMLQILASATASLDVLAALAEVAVQEHYTRPRLRPEALLLIQGGRHPVIEKTLPAGQFVPNDAYLDIQDQRLIILTGPNMSGKSSFMRQTGLIVLMAQMGSFVPAAQAEIGICDRIFTRVGAVDDIATGQSTFMVEMVETSNILHHATPRSLVLLDEIGRGTSTFDGVSIAWAVSEYIARELRSRTVFATHYHELNRLAENVPGVKNFQVSVQENADGIVFLHKVVPGGADRSYGIEVARLAGLPAPVLERAKGLLQDIEKRSRIQSGLMKKARADAPEPDVVQLSLFEG